MKQAYETACPLSKVRKKNVPWWNKELSTMRKKVSHQYWMALRSHDFDDWDQYYAYKREYKYLIRKSKRNSWRNYCSELSNYTDSARLIRILKQDRVIQLGSIKKSDGAHTDSTEETLVELLRVHFPGCTFVKTTHIFLNFYCFTVSCTAFTLDIVFAISC